MSEQAFRRLLDDLGDLLASQGTRRKGDYLRYRDNPVGFIRDVLGGKPWARQVEIAEAVGNHAQVTVRSCHAAGKDWLAARLALWWVYARRGLVVLTGPTASQVEEILMRRQVLAAFRAGGLPGTLHIKALRPGGDDSAGIVARTGVGVHGMTGLHEAQVLFVITEAQDPDIEHAWDAGFACTTGKHDRLLTLGNPTESTGRFYRAHQTGSGWHVIKIEASDIPNVQQGRTVIPGLLTREGVERIVREYGETSPFVASRVHAEFPSEATDSLVTADWLDRAVELHKSGALEREAAFAHYVLGCDPARLGPDRTVVCLRQGPVVREFVGWRGLDTMQTADRVQMVCRRLLTGYQPDGRGGGVDAVYVDEIGLGGGVLDRLRETLPVVQWSQYVTERMWPDIRTRHVHAVPFNAAKTAGQSDRFTNMRAQAYWTLRKQVEEGKLALPDLKTLREELLATRVRFGADGRTQIEPKEAVKARLGRSPDYADALVISLAPLLKGVGRRRVRVSVR